MACRKLAACACAAYLVGGGADAEDEPRGEVGPGERLRERGRQDEEVEEESSAAERLPHRAQLSQSPSARRRPRGADGFIRGVGLGPGAGRPRWRIGRFPCGRRR